MLSLFLMSFRVSIAVLEPQKRPKTGNKKAEAKTASAQPFGWCHPAVRTAITGPPAKRFAGNNSWNDVEHVSLSWAKV
jgi:hypothetical protein